MPDLIEEMKTIRLILTFYKSFALSSYLITFACFFIMHQSGKNGIYLLQALFWFKIFTLGILVLFNNSYKRNEFYYYKNLGVTKLTLWLPILVFDFLFFLITLITIASYNYGTHP